MRAQIRLHTMLRILIIGACGQGCYPVGFGIGIFLARMPLAVSGDYFSFMTGMP